jgi:tetratricopeptide (TPR) repeat protein
MGFFDFLFGKKKMTLDEANQVNQQYTAQNPVPASNQSAMVRQASNLMTSRKFQESIAMYEEMATRFPESKGTYLGQMGAGYYFLGDYAQAIDYYVQAREAGAMADMMDDNIWEACEAIYENSRNKADVERYFELCPKGGHAREANKILGK